MPLLFKLIVFTTAVILFTGCETNGADNTVVAETKNGDLDFYNKKYNRKVASREEKKWRDKKTIFKSGNTAANPAGGLEPSAESQTQAPQQSQPNVVYNYKPNPDLKYGSGEPSDYEEYKRWKAASGVENSPEYQRFKLWQEFENYRKWQESQGAE